MADATVTESAVSPEAPEKLRPGPGRSREEVVAHQLDRIQRALIELVAENGYENLKVRDLVKRAKVSSKSFYELFGGKEDCFVDTYDRFARRATRRMIASQVGEPDWRQRLRLILDEFVGGLEHSPVIAEFTLVDAYACGSACREHAWQAEQILAEALGDCLARAPGGVLVPPLVLEGIVSGIAGVSRKHLQSRKRGSLSLLRDVLADWALSLVGEATMELRELDRGLIWRDTMLEPSLAGELRRVAGDRALILKAVAVAATQHGYAWLTPERISTAAHLSRGKFFVHFDEVEDCFVAALEQRMEEALVRAARAQVDARSWGGGAYRAIAAHCRCINNDPFLNHVLLEGDFPPGSSGTRVRERIAHAITDQLFEYAPAASRPSPLELEASSHAAWALLQRHLLRQPGFDFRPGATLAYLLLAPAVGSHEALAAIRGEQEPGAFGRRSTANLSIAS